MASWNPIINCGLAPPMPPEDDYEYDPAHDDVFQLPSRCPECGSNGACGFDDEGRPLIHAAGNVI